MTDAVVKVDPMKPQEQYLQQQEASLALQDALSDGLRLGLPVLSWSVTNGGVLCGEVLSKSPREDFSAWAEYLAVVPEDLSRDGETKLRVITDSGLPGRKRQVRVIVLARFYEKPDQNLSAA
ncbi:hypothetical protein [Streptomyces rubradiris]|uniref:Uncharacterized protein n=1 Tax=Streptomyces rubradiris TaxID=285531 RepID=A0ABQ3RAB9_STRRR|nr:hypothetical protein [Streptomyces rubradiris]GHH26050.1 hypothetical protein GCM10018792_66010 [Streptomyces rubradiris]GHI52806.1 hypothetical protein Srubr_26520 [Streptomyces rubradiris]